MSGYEPRLTQHGDRIHDLKTWPRWFADVAARRKEFEVRSDDRGIEPGDWLLLHEWDPASGEHTGRKLIRRVTYVLRGSDAVDVGVYPGFCVLGLAHNEAQA